MSATLLVLLSAALHATWNALLKRHRAPEIGGIVVLAVAALCSGVPALGVPGAAFPTRAALVATLFAGVAEAAYFFTLGKALRALPLGVAYTMSRGGSVLVIWPLSVLWLGERAGLLAAGGVALVLAGLVLTGSRRESAPRASARGLAWSAACAAFIALVYVGYKAALKNGAESTALFAVSLLVAVPLNVVALGAGALPRIGSELRAHPRLLLAAGVLCAASFLLFLGALRDSGAGRVLTLRNTSVVFAQALGWLAGESPRFAYIVGAVLVMGGAVLLSVG